MTNGLHRPPDIARRDVASVLVSEWMLGSPDRQRAIIEAVASARERTPWPVGLLSDSWYTSMDGNTVLRYSQRADAGDVRAAVEADPLLASREFQSAVSGQEPSETSAYRLYRSSIVDGPSRVPGCIVIARVQFDGPNPQRQQEWVDAVFEAGEEDDAAIPGLIAAHFHVRTDGTRVLNYAEWTDEAAHRAFFEEAPAEDAPPETEESPAWQRIHAWPGIVGGGVGRYRFEQGVTRRLGAETTG